MGPIKVKADKVSELTEKMGFKSHNHPQIGMIVEKDGLIFTSKGQLVGIAMPLPLPTAKVIAELVQADILIEDTGLVLDGSAPPQEAPEKAAAPKKSILIGG